MYEAQLAANSPKLEHDAKSGKIFHPQATLPILVEKSDNKHDVMQ